MDRLFGRELSNLIHQNMHNRTKQIGRIHSQSTRSSSQDHSKILLKRFNRSSFGQPLTKRNEKIQVVSILMEDQKQQPKDVQLVGQYFQDCFKFMMEQEKKCYKLKNYLHQETEITQKMRGILLDWIIDLHHKFKMFPQTLFATAAIIDKYISKKSASKQNLQLIGTAALYIAAKYQQTYQVPSLDDLVYFAAKAFTKQQIIKMQADIIDALDFNLIIETSFRFLQPLAKMCKMQDKNFHLAQYTLELSLLDPKFLQYNPSLLASSAIYLINKIRKRSQSWPTSLIKFTGYEQSKLKNCARQLCHLLERVEQLANTKSIKKKFSLAEYHEVTRIKLQRKKQ